MEAMESMEKSISLTITEACNLNCIYCYENHKSQRMMKFETAKEILDYELTVDDGKDIVTIEFFGGEPFLNFPLIQDICEYVWSKAWPKKYIFFASTNGTLVHNEIKQWVQDHKERFWLGLSIDGNEYMQNINRCNSFSSIDLDFFANLWPEQTVKMTVSRETLPHLADGCIFLHRKGFKISCNLACGIDWSDPENKRILSTQLSVLIDYYVSHPDVKPCSMLDRHIEGFVENRVEFHKWCGAGTNMRVYSVTGDYYPCQFFMPLSIGEIKSNQSFNIDFTDDNALRDPMCDNCLLITICPTCYGSNYANTGDVSRKDKNECELSKLTILANSYYKYKLLATYSDEELGITVEHRILLTDAIVAIQSFFADISR